MTATNRVIVSILVIAAVAIFFWLALLGPKRERASELGAQVETLEFSLSEAEAKAARAELAKREFPSDYRKLVVLGQAVPASDETSSLLVELNRIAKRTDVSFDSLLLTGSGQAPAPVAATPPATQAPEAEAEAGSGAVPAAATVPPTEVAAATMPLGASIGPAGLAVMPYTLTFSGTFFEVADFIAEIDGMVHAKDAKVAVDGRLITLDGFALGADVEAGFPNLKASFSVTTYLTPPSQGVTAGATPTTPPPATTTPAGAAPADAESAPVATEK